jgi:3-oxoacyl-[acyl-carrier protein] reductase
MANKGEPKGKVVWLTGASGGLGSGIARRLAAAGYRLALHAGSSIRRVRALASALTQAGAEVVVTSGDLSEPGVAEHSVASIRELMESPWALVHLAGPYVHGEIVTHSRTDFDRMLSGNLTTLFEAIRAVVPGMRDAREGRIISTAMMGAHQTFPMLHTGPHLAAKAGVAALTRTLALEEAKHGITANVISPGHIPHKEIDRKQARKMEAGPTHPMVHHGSYDDLADAILYLLSPGGSYVTGAVLEITGGWRGEDFLPHRH